jgi:hypothetical protein
VGWALTTLTVFAFCPWHLAQARFGSFYSLCTALAFALLWFGERTRDRRSWTAWLGLGICAAAISWAYAPLQVLYVFFAAVVAAGFGYAGRRWQPLIAIAVFAVIISLQLSQGGREAFMRSDFGQLATDTVIWRKDAEHATTTVTQPLVVVADNFARNIKWWFQETFKETDILVWWAPALGLGFHALYDLWRAHGRMRLTIYRHAAALLIFRCTADLDRLAAGGVAGMRLSRPVETPRPVAGSRGWVALRQRPSASRSCSRLCWACATTRSATRPASSIRTSVRRIST